MKTRRLSVGVFGAGSIGCHLGISLSAAGASVTFVGRSSWMDAGPKLQVVSRDGDRLMPRSDATFTTDAAALRGVEVCLVTVKSPSTAEAAEALAAALGPGVPVVSCQNGLSNAGALREALGDRVAAAMVPFNVFRTGDEVVQATRGPLVVERVREGAHAVDRLVETFSLAGLPVRRCESIADVAAGKLLLNLNNGVCAATGLSIRDSLRDRDARWLLARCMLEGQRALQRAGYRPWTTLPLPIGAIARLLAAPDAVVLRVAKSLLSVDERARSSTLQDIEAGRTTEIDHLNGSIVRMAAALGVPCPVNHAIVQVVRDLEAGGAFVSPRHLRARAQA